MIVKLNPTFLYFILFLFIYFSFYQCLRMKDQITVDLPSVKHYCFRLLNGSTSVGCQSHVLGNKGALAIINKADDLKREVANLPYGISNIIAIVNINLFVGDLVDTLKNSEIVSGILLLKPDIFHSIKFSEDSICPNDVFFVREKSETKSCDWNRKGAIHPLGFRFLSFKKPIFMITNDSDINFIKEKCYNAFNRNLLNHRCMAKMTQFMRADGNIEICMRRKKLGVDICDPLGDNNIFGLLPAKNLTSAAEKTNIFMLATRMDSFSAFANSEGGDISTLTSVIAALSIADAIGVNLNTFLKEAKLTNRQLLIAFFHGESVGYIGSSRMVWEMNLNKFPLESKKFSSPSSNIKQIKLTDLGVYLELQQLKFSDSINLHSSFEVYSRNSSILDEIAETVKKNVISNEFNFNFFKEKSVLFPPSSYYSILKKTTQIPAVLLTSYHNSYNSSHINSILDTDITTDKSQRLLYVKYIMTAAQASLNLILNHISNGNSSLINKFVIRRDYIEELMFCFFSKDWDCSLFQTLLNSTKKFDNGFVLHLNKNYKKILARYLFIGTEGQYSLIRILVHALLVRSLGEKWATPNVSTESQCSNLNINQNVYKFVWQFDNYTKKPLCYQTSIYETEAKSPAFEEENYDFKSGKYSTWAESVWDAHSRLEIYLKSDIWLDLYALLTASLVVIVSIPLKLFIKENWFFDSNEPPSSAPRL